MAGRPEAPVPDGWRTAHLGEVADIQKGVSFTSKELVPGNVPVIAGGREPAYYHNSSNRPAGTVTVSASGAYAGFVAFHDTPILATDCTTVRARPGFSDTTFVFHALKQSERVLYQRRSGSAHPHVYPRDIASLSVLFPPLPEQLAIAAVLDSIDEAIERTEEVITATERLRDALLHELLTRGLPGHHTTWRDVPGLGTIPADWEVVRLGDVCAPSSYGAAAPARSFDPKLPRYVRITDITDDGRLRPDDARSADPAQVEGFELEPGDLLFARSGATVGKTFLYRSEDGPCVYAGYLIKFRALPETAVPEFLELWTRSPFYRKWVASMLRAGAQPNINAAEYSSLSLALPPLPEQRAIVSALDSVEAAIERTRAERAALQSSKASTADALLTGRVRVGVRG